MLDDNGNDKYIVKNLLVAVVGDSAAASFSLVLSALIFHGSSYHIFDEGNDKHIEILPIYDRPLVCIPDGYVDMGGYDGRLMVTPEERDRAYERYELYRDARVKLRIWIQ